MFRFTVATFATAALFLAACGGAESELTDLANETCNDLENAIVLQVGQILGSAIADAEDLGFTGPELGDKMREECPLTMAALEGLEAEQERKDNLPSQMRVNTERCTGDGASGTVTNNSDVTVDVWISVQYINESGILVADGLDSIDRIQPGETATWKDEQYDYVSFLDECRAIADSVFES